MPMVLRLRLRFFCATALISALLLLITFATSFFATALRTYSVVDDKLNEAINGGFSPRGNIDDMDCMLVLYMGDVYYTERSEQYTQAEQKEIISKMLTSKKTFFTYDKRVYFSKSSAQSTVVLYAVYDATSEINTITRLLYIMLIAFFSVYIVILIVAWWLSASTLKPVVQALDRQKELIANASHELKTPLTIIDTQLVLVKEEEGLTENAEKWLDGIGYQTKRMTTLIKEMLELSKLEANNEIQPETVKISELFESTILSMEASCFEKEITSESNIIPDLEIVTDKVKLEKLMTILLDNAFKYTPRGGVISVNLYKRKRYVIFSVKNTGAGIPKDKIPKLFERFYKAEESHTEESNSFGLGLSIAKSLAEVMQGTIKCASEEGKYTEFMVALPLLPTVKKEALTKETK